MPRDDLADARRTSGPLMVPPAYTAWFEVDEGEVFSDGFDILRTREDLRIESVSLLGQPDDDSLTFLGARIGLPGRPDDFNQRMKGFPPSAVPARFQTEAEGASLSGGESYMLILGFRVESTKPSVREGVRIDYTVGDIEYTAQFESRVVTCPPPLNEDRCSELYPATGTGTG